MRRDRAWDIAAAWAWCAVLVILLVRAGMHPARATSLTTYLAGGEAWDKGGAIYTNWRGFVYPPVAACFFGMLRVLPAWLGAMLWRALTAGVFVAGLWRLLHSKLFPRLLKQGLVWAAVLPLAIGNLDNAQANPLIAGLMMLSVGAFAEEAWWACAAAAGLAISIKVYPLALGLLLCLLRPRQLSWRILLIMAVLALLPFALKDHVYVASQYRAWLDSRLTDDRFHYPMKDAPLDLWYLLVRVGHLPVSPRLYQCLQLAAAAGIAYYIWTRCRCAGTVFLLASVWMLLLGPATENQTYIVLAPAAAIAACETRPRSMAAIAALILLIAAAARNSLFPHFKGPWAMAVQPIAALILAAALIARERATAAELPPDKCSASS